MHNIVFLDGPNFSGRSKLIGQWLIAERGRGRPVVFVGPSIASALTGLASTVATELDLYSAWNALPPPSRLQAYFEPKQKQILASLSGGEQVLLALAGIGRPAIQVGIDCALEQLDDTWRTWTLEYLRDASGDAAVQLADNQISSAAELYCEMVRLPSGSSEYRVQLGTMLQRYRSATDNESLVVEGLSFRYPKGPLVFHDCSFQLTAGNVYRLRGSNGAGKSTLVRLLSGVLPFQSGSMFVNGRLYEPYREGNRLIALAMQNPDEQWIDINIAGDLKRRLAHVNPLGKLPAHNLDGLLEKCEASLGVSGLLQQHVLDFPRVLRKRLSWIWPLSGYLPWLVFDEPTLGQDDATVKQFADAICECAAQGYGVIYIAHDERLPHLVHGTDLLLENGRVVKCRL
jgi:energy-coupling factor transporter ATP-binding protein EcfA2